ncbi:unnamed protein product [Laminaria digitata]
MARCVFVSFPLFFFRRRFRFSRRFRRRYVPDCQRREWAARRKIQVPRERGKTQHFCQKCFGLDKKIYYCSLYVFEDFLSATPPSRVRSAFGGSRERATCNERCIDSVADLDSDKSAGARREGMGLGLGLGLGMVN